MKGKLTLHGIANNLEDSPYLYKINYTPNSYVVYVFSSKLYMTKFDERLEHNRKSINKSLSNRFGFEIVNNILCDIKLYASIEKRGFLIKTNTNREGFKCRESLRLDGKNLTVKN